jgi:hypothetical protein
MYNCFIIEVPRPVASPRPNSLFSLHRVFFQALARPAFRWNYVFFYIFKKRCNSANSSNYCNKSVFDSYALAGLNVQTGNKFARNALMHLYQLMGLMVRE